ncbi:hypothetical protein HAX54_010399, partial [Datura stramonium]|nr:hypothetical protein [Datura stramonium]
MSTIRRGFDRGSDRISSLRKSLRIPTLSDHRPKQVSESSRKKILDPQGSFLQFWNKIFVLACVISVAIDPLFFYISVIDNKRKCLDLDHALKIPISIFAIRVSGLRTLSLIAKRYLLPYFFIDILAVLPLPQMVLFIIAPSMNHPISEQLKIAIFIQYIPRILRIYPLYKEVTRTTGFFTETAWAGAAFNLFLFMLASNIPSNAQSALAANSLPPKWKAIAHVVGAFWYLITVERQDDCWREVCHHTAKCVLHNLYCDQGGNGNAQFLYSSCPLLQPEDIHENDFDFGIFLDALHSRVVGRRNFWSKFFYCFCWGLQNLSSLGQDLNPSNSVEEILFAIFICIVGLILFSLLIGNMQ